MWLIYVKVLSIFGENIEYLHCTIIFGFLAKYQKLIL